MTDGDLSAEALPKSVIRARSPGHLDGATGSASTEEEYYLDLLVCSDVLSAEDDVAWRLALHSPALRLLSPGREDPEWDEGRHPDPQLRAAVGSPRPQAEAAAVAGSASTPPQSRAPGKGSERASAVPPEVSARWKGNPLTLWPTSVKGVEANHGRARLERVFSGGRIDFDRVQECKTTEGERGEGFQEEFRRRLSSKEDDPAERGGQTRPFFNADGPGLGRNASRSPRLRATDCRPPQTRLKGGSSRVERAGIPESSEERAFHLAEMHTNEPMGTQAEIQPLLLKEEATRFRKSTTSSNNEDNPIVCHEKKTNLLALDANVNLSLAKYRHDQEAACGRLKADSEIIHHPILDRAISQSTELKDKYQVQVLQEKKSNLIPTDNALVCTSKEYQRSNVEAKVECTKHDSNSVKRDGCLENLKSELSEDTSIYNKEMGSLGTSSELGIHSDYIDHQASVISKGFESDLLKKVDKYGSIDPHLGTPLHLSIHAQVKDASESLSIGSNMLQDSDKESKFSSYYDTNNEGRNDKFTFQVRPCVGNKPKEINVCRDEFEYFESSFGSVGNLGVPKEQTDQFKESIFENECSQNESPKSHSNKVEILCPLKALENNVYKEDISTHQSTCTSHVEVNEAIRNCSDSQNSNEMPYSCSSITGFAEIHELSPLQTDDKLPIEHSASFESNLGILANQHLTFDNKSNGSNYPSKEMESKIGGVLTEFLVVNNQEASTSMLMDCEKMQYNEPSLVENSCWNHTFNRTKNNDNEGIPNIFPGSKDVCKAEADIDKNKQKKLMSKNNYELVCKQFYNSAIGFLSAKDGHFNSQLRTGQNSEIIPPLKYVVGLQKSNEPEVVQSDNLKSQLVAIEQNISTLIGTIQQRMIKIEEKKVVNAMHHSECPTPKEQKLPIAGQVVTEQPVGLQQFHKSVQNLVEHVGEIEMEDDHRKMKTMKNVRTIPINHLEPSLINEPRLKLTKIINFTVQDETSFQSLSLQAPDKTKVTENIHETIIHPSGNVMSSADLPLHSDESLFQSTTNKAEKSTANYNICSTEFDSELDHVNENTTSADNLASAVLSVSPSKTEHVKGGSSTSDWNENIQRAEFKTYLSKISNFVANNNKSVESQLINCRKKETVLVIADGNKSIQQNNSFRFTSTNSRGSNKITQQVAGRKMNVNFTAAKNCRDQNKTGLNKSNYQVIVPDQPLEYIKMDIDDKCQETLCQMSSMPSKSNQKSSCVSKIENVTLSKNDGQAKHQGTQTLNTSVDDSQKRSIDPELLSSLQCKSLSKKSFPPVESHGTAVSFKQPININSVREQTMSDARKESNIPHSSDAIAFEAGDLFPSRKELQKKKEIKDVLPVNKVKITFEKNKHVQLSRKENLNKNTVTIKGMFHKIKEEPIFKEEQKKVEKLKQPQKEEHKAPKLIQKIHAEVVPDIPENVKLWCLFGDIHAVSTITWTKDGMLLTKREKSTGDETPVSLAIVHTTKKDRGLYQCTLKNVYGSVSSEFDFTTEVLNDLHHFHAEGILGNWENQSLRVPDEPAAEFSECNPLKLCNLSTQKEGEKVELLQPIIEKELTSECNFQPKIYGSIVTEESHFGEGLHRKAFRTKVLYGFIPVFDPGHSCVLKIHNAISYGTKTKNEFIQRNYILAVQECHVQNAARQYGNMFSAKGTLLEGFGKAPEIIPIYLVHRPANNIPYATVEEELKGDFVKYSVKDGRELNVGRKESEVGQKCCTFQHWVYEWTEGNLLVTDLQGVGLKLTDVGIATCSKGYRGFKGNCSVSFIDQFKALHQCNAYCKIMGLKSLKVSQHKPRWNQPMKAPLLKPAPSSPKEILVSSHGSIRNFTIQAKSIIGDRTIQKHL
ncbi:uncharacterized protein [Narcine bancroftii]|uniref:uncharacterized protein n=1 Tax=Narcine bancroftii TaxID=1343680 RepID=UPI003831B2A1